MKNKTIPQTCKVHPFWDETTAPAFLKRTQKQYVSIDFTSLDERGIKNEMLTRLLAALPGGAYVVGGFAMHLFNGSKDAKDIDIAFTSEQAFKDTANLFLQTPEKVGEEDLLWPFRGYTLDQDLDLFIGDNTKARFLSFTHNEDRPKVQLLKLAWYDSPEHIIDSFDFTITQFAMNKERIITNFLSVIDLSRKRLVLHRMQFPASTMRRIIKYTQKGFYICPGSLIDICKEIQNHQGDQDIDANQYVYLD
jgi:hypothetical protein